MTAGIGNKSESIDYGSLKSKVDLIFGIGTGTSGYGQSISSPSVQTNSIITAESWQLLRNDMVKARQHQTGITVGTSSSLDNNNLIPIYNGTLITETIRNQYEKFSNALVMDKYKVHPSQLTNQVLVSGHRTTSWANTITHSVIISASSAGNGASENLRYFFNAGGTITIQSSRINGTISTVNNLWSSLLNSCGNISLSLSTTSKSGNSGNASPIGFINLSTTNQIIFHNSRSGATASDTLSFKVSAMVNSSRSQIFLTIEYSNNESNVTGDNFSKNINGDLYSIVSQNVPSGSNVNVYSLSATHSGIDLGVAPIRYRLLPSITSQNEGGVVTYTVECSEPEALTLYWRTIGNTTNLDFEDNILSGSVTLDNNGFGTISRTIAQDYVSEGNEQFYIQLYNTQNVVLANSPPVNINDTTVYSMSVSSYSVNEGGSINFTINSSNRAIGNTLFVTLSGSITTSDIVNGLHRILTFNTNTVTSTITIANDSTIESNETFCIQIRVGSYSGAIILESSPITIIDTTPTYKITLTSSSPINVAEGNSINFSVNTTHVPNGSIVYYNPTGNVTDADFTGGMYGRYLTINNGVGYGSIPILKDSASEGLETFNIQLRTGGPYGSVVDTSTSVNISPSGSLLFTVAGYTNWTVPPGVTAINYKLVSGGGGGASGSCGDDDGWSGGGGASGGIYSGSIKVSPGNVLTICVGYGGQKNAGGGESAIYVNGTKITAIAGGAPGKGKKGGVGGVNGANGGGGTWADDDNENASGGKGGINSSGYGTGGKGGAFYSGAGAGKPGSTGMVSLAW